VLQAFLVYVYEDITGKHLQIFPLCILTEHVIREKISYFVLVSKNKARIPNVRKIRRSKKE
jgi:hypothetical protein